MEHKNRLANRLYIVSTVLFYVLALFAAQLIICDAFVEPTDSFISFPHHKYGYSVPVTINLNQTQDTTIIYHNTDNSKSGQITSTNIKKGWNKEFRAILNNPQYTKKLTIDSLTIYGNRSAKINAEFSTIKAINTNGQLVINPKDLFFKILLALRNYAFIFTVMYALWHVKGFFKELRTQFSFNADITYRLKTIGYILLGYQIFNFIMCIIIQQQYSYVSVAVVSDNTIREMYNMSPKIEFSPEMILLALSLLLISRLLNKGFEMQQENDLTI